jgi:hypothetical protein
MGRTKRAVAERYDKKFTGLHARGTGRHGYADQYKARRQKSCAFATLDDFK